MEPSQVDDVDEFSSFVKTEVSPGSSSTNLSATHNNDSGDDSDHSSREPRLEPGQRKRDFVPFQGDDTSFSVIHLPPDNTEIKLYSDLFNHFQQSTLLFQAFRERFRMIPFTCLILIC